MPRLIRWTVVPLVLAGLSLTVRATAQDVTAGNNHTDSRVDLFGGYSYLRPVQNSNINGYAYPELYNPNADVSLAFYDNRFLGLQVEGTYFSGNQNKPYGTCLAENCSQIIYTAQAGPIFRFPLGPFVPFAHALGGGERTNGPANQSLAWGYGITGGLGVDIVLPPFNHLFALRPIQADYQYSQVKHGTLVDPPGTIGGTGILKDIKLTAGIVARFGDVTPPYPLMLGCGADPADAYPGDTVTITSQEKFANPKKTPVYKYTSTAGVVTAADSGATVDTTGVAPGSYTVTGHVSEGNRPSQQASCQAPFTVRAFDPPTISCSANPTTGLSGTDFAITSTASSPQKRPLTYSYTSTAGVIAGAGSTAKLSTAGLSPSTITVTCTVADDVSHTVSATADIVLTAPPVPVIPQTEQLCSLSFTRDKRRPVRVDNEAKGCLDDIALTLNKQTDARLVIVGNAAPGDKPEAAAERSLNARQYLVQEKGIDASRIELRTGDAPEKTANNTLVPPGATFKESDVHTFDEKTIVRHGQAYGTHKSKKPSAAKPSTPTP
jgi:hypothetical protein